jgi:hypothetical protein
MCNSVSLGGVVFRKETAPLFYFLWLTPLTWFWGMNVDKHSRKMRVNSKNHKNCVF